MKAWTSVEAALGVNRAGGYLKLMKLIVAAGAENMC